MASTSVMPSPLSQLVVRVGGPGELSSLETREGETIITAQPGGESDRYDGGAGYSGGGGGSSRTDRVIGRIKILQKNQKKFQKFFENF